VPSFWGVLSVRLVIEGTIIVIVLVIMLFIVLPLSVPVLNLTLCMSAADDVAQVTVVSATPLAVLLWWSDVAVRVPMGTLSVVIFVTPISVIPVMSWIHHGCCV
jgi:hypothetical protein